MSWNSHKRHEIPLHDIFRASRASSRNTRHRLLLVTARPQNVTQYGTFSDVRHHWIFDGPIHIVFLNGSSPIVCVIYISYSFSRQWLICSPILYFYWTFVWPYPFSANYFSFLFIFSTHSTHVSIAHTYYFYFI